MDAKWIHTKTITGSVADGARYFRRKTVEDKLWREIEKGNHILFSAPRRVGKSSVMKYIADNPREGFLCVYENISTDRTASEFYRRILEMLPRHSLPAKFKEWWDAGPGSWRIEEIDMDGPKLRHHERNYKQALLDAIGKLKEGGIKVVLFLDEFPDVIKNISEAEAPDSAVDVLQTLRSLRHNSHFKEHFVLVLAGSIGLAHVIKDIDRPAVINDLHEQNLPALSRTEAETQSESEADRFIIHLVDGASMQVGQECRKHLMDKLQNAIPFYIQLLVEKCNEMLCEENRTQLSTPDIDRAWELVLVEHKHFADADERLKDYFPKDYPYFVQILSHCAHEGTISVQQAYDFGHAFELGAAYKAKIDDVLVKDGYLQQEGLHFHFASPLLQAWWKNRYPKVIRKP